MEWTIAVPIFSRVSAFTGACLKYKAALCDLALLYPYAICFSMNGVLVLTISGEDRAGLVEKLADVNAEHGGNWEH